MVLELTLSTVTLHVQGKETTSQPRGRIRGHISGNVGQTIVQLEVDGRLRQALGKKLTYGRVQGPTVQTRENLKFRRPLLGAYCTTTLNLLEIERSRMS